MSGSRFRLSGRGPACFLGACVRWVKGFWSLLVRRAEPSLTPGAATPAHSPFCSPPASPLAVTPAVAWGAGITGRVAVCVQKASVGGPENVGENFQLKGQQLFLQDQGRRERKSGHVGERVLKPVMCQALC